MNWIESLTLDPRFWTFYLGSTTGQIGPAVDELDWRSLFDVSPTQSWEWMVQKGLGSGDDLGIRVIERAGVSLYLDLTEELDYVLETQTHADGLLLANVGGHWILPGLRWEEAETASRFPHPALREADGTEGTALALLLPSVWLCTSEERARAREILPQIFRSMNVSSDDERALRLTDAWIASVDATESHGWSVDSHGWKTNAHWSVRAEAAKHRAEINFILDQLLRPN